jgi:hypothetical protein
MATGDKSGELIILPPLGPHEKAQLKDYFNEQPSQNGIPKGTQPSNYPPFEVTPKGIGWDSMAPGVSYKNLQSAADWLTDFIIPQFIAPLRHMSGKLVVEGEGAIVVKDNVVYVIPDNGDSAEAPHGYKADGTPKSKPGPKPKSLKEVLAEKKGNTYEPGSASSEESEKIVGDLQAKIVALEQQLAEAKKPKKAKVPAGKRWVRLTIPKEMDKEKFIEGVKLTIMGIEGEPEVFE